MGMSSNLGHAPLWMVQGIVTLLLLTWTLPAGTGNKEDSLRKVSPIPFPVRHASVWWQSLFLFSPHTVRFVVSWLLHMALQSIGWLHIYHQAVAELFSQSIIFWKPCFWQAGHQTTKVEKSCYLNISILLPIKYSTVFAGFQLTIIKIGIIKLY